MSDTYRTRILAALKDGRERTVNDLRYKTKLPDGVIRDELPSMAREGLITSFAVNRDPSLRVYKLA